jgi:hypothetical protein
MGRYRTAIVDAGGIAGDAHVPAVRGLAYRGEHDGVDRSSTLVFATAGRESVPWFVRTDPTPQVSPAHFFYDAVPLAPGATLRLAYRVLVADGAWGRARIEAALSAADG